MTAQISATLASSPPEGASAAPLVLTWKQPQGLFTLSLVNTLLRIITLGLYGFWAKTEVRRRIWSAVRIDGEPLQYMGTGRELFLGFLIVFFVVLLPVLLASVAVVITFGPESPASDAWKIGLYIGFLYLAGLAVYRAQRYRLSRTLWRAIRGRLEGSTAAYAWSYFWTAIMVPLTLGWILPWRATRLQAMMTRDMRFGDQPFTFTARSAPLYRRFAILWLTAAAVLASAGSLVIMLAFPEFERYARAPASPFQPDGGVIVATLLVLVTAYLLVAIISAWYRAHQVRHFAAHTHYQGATFESSVTARGLIWLAITNVAIVVATLGILSPIAQARAAGYMVSNLKITGAVDLAAVAQAANAPTLRGEGLAQALELDAFDAF